MEDIQRCQRRGESDAETRAERNKKAAPRTKKNKKQEEAATTVSRGGAEIKI
jgi:hypothetical protein